jgi:PncC family amidohydrolase
VNEVKGTAEQIVEALRERWQTLAAAESCTGGLVGHLITEVPGSSDVFLGGVIVYANALKQMVGVPSEVLREHGAVSGETAAALASGIRSWAGADYGLSITGIAGPGGATETKPVGLTFIGLATPSAIGVEHLRFTGNRSENKRAAAQSALDMLLGALRRPSVSGGRERGNA